MDNKRFESSNKALLLIDIQEDYTGKTAKSPFPYKNAEQLIENVNLLIEKALQKKMVIVYIKQEFRGPIEKILAYAIAHGTAIKGRPGTEIDSRIIIASDFIFSKSMPNAFSNPKLKTLLDKHQVDEVYLTGIDAKYCVFATAKGALKRGYRVNMVTDGVALRKENEWDKILAQYKNKGIKLITSQEFKKENYNRSNG